MRPSKWYNIYVYIYMLSSLLEGSSPVNGSRMAVTCMYDTLHVWLFLSTSQIYVTIYCYMHLFLQVDVDTCDLFGCHIYINIYNNKALLIKLYARLLILHNFADPVFDGVVLAGFKSRVNVSLLANASFLSLLF